MKLIVGKIGKEGINMDIKFRVFGWNCDKLKWELNPFGYELLNQSGAIEHDDSFCEEDIDDVVIELYTGTDDKNNVEIYDGDILCEDSFGRKYYYVVEWYRGCFFLMSIDDSSRKAMFLNFEDDYETEFEVIGNIHENPELLEGK